jgi:hypothetical protein
LRRGAELSAQGRGGESRGASFFGKVGRLPAVGLIMAPLRQRAPL